MIDIKNLNKAEVLVALYNASKIQGMGFLQAKDSPLTIEEAEKLLTRGTYFDYLYGKVMKIDLSSNDSFDERLYDRDNGEGAALRAIQIIKRRNLTMENVKQAIFIPHHIDDKVVVDMPGTHLNGKIGCVVAVLPASVEYPYLEPLYTIKYDNPTSASHGQFMHHQLVLLSTPIAKTCKDCGAPFLISEDEAAWLKRKGLAEFERCKPCREKRKAVRVAKMRGEKEAPNTMPGKAIAQTMRNMGMAPKRSGEENLDV